MGQVQLLQTEEREGGLQVCGDGVVNASFDASIAEVLAKRISLPAEHREDVVILVPIFLFRQQSNSCDQPAILGRQLPPGFIPRGESLEFYTESSTLNSLESIVEA
jgi:hypothetical protein